MKRSGLSQTVEISCPLRAVLELPTMTASGSIIGITMKWKCSLKNAICGFCGVGSILGFLELAGDLGGASFSCCIRAVRVSRSRSLSSAPLSTQLETHSYARPLAKKTTIFLFLTEPAFFFSSPSL